MDSLVATDKTAILWRADVSYTLDVAEFEAALAAWDVGRPDEAREKLQNAVDKARDLNFS